MNLSQNSITINKMLTTSFAWSKEVSRKNQPEAALAVGLPTKKLGTFWNSLWSVPAFSSLFCRIKDANFAKAVSNSDLSLEINL